MSLTFEISIEDVIIASSQLGVTIYKEVALELYDELDMNRVEHQALKTGTYYENGDEDFYDDMQEQLDAAMEEIRLQLEENQYFKTLKNK